MNIEQAGATVEMLEECFAEVFIRGSSEPVVIARGHNRMPASGPCKHERIVRAKDVQICITKGYLVSGQNPMQVASVEFCQRCELVVNVVHPEELKKPRVLKKVA